MNLAMQFALVTYLLLGELGLKIVQSQIGKPVPPDKLKYSQKEALELTNRLRSKHQAPALQYDEVVITTIASNRMPKVMLQAQLTLLASLNAAS